MIEMEKRPSDGKNIKKTINKKSGSTGIKKSAVNKPAPSPKNNVKKSVKNEREQRTNRLEMSKRNISQNNVYKIRNAVPSSDVDKKAEEILDKPKKRDSSNKNKKRNYEKTLAPAKAPISPYRRKLKRIFFYTVTLTVLVIICCVLSMTVFFKIDNIEVQGKTRYGTEDIVASSCIKKGDNLILCNTGNAEKLIEKDFPYIEKADIEKRLFNTIVINVTEAKPASIIESNGQYVVLSSSGKIIEVDKSKKYNIPTVLGAELKSVKLSSTAKFKDDNINNYIKEINSCIGNMDIKNIEVIDISNLSKISLIRKNGFRIIIGTPENIDYKLKTAKAIMDKNIKDDDKGTLDVSLASSNGGKSYFSSDNGESLKSNANEESKDTNSAEESVEENNSEENKNENSDEESNNEENKDESSNGESVDESSSETLQ